MTGMALRHRLEQCCCSTSKQTGSSVRLSVPALHIQSASSPRQYTRRRLPVCSSAVETDIRTDTAKQSYEYTATMQKKMNWDKPFEYHYDRGLYYHEVYPGVFCGTQPRNPDEVSEIQQTLGITTIVNVSNVVSYVVTGFRWT